MSKLKYIVLGAILAVAGTVLAQNFTRVLNLRVMEDLEVNGDTNLGGELLLDGVAGTSGQVLTSNGAGMAPTWQAGGGGGGGGETGNFTVTWDTGCTVSQNQDFSYLKFNDVVILYATEEVECTSNDINVIATEGLPMGLRPASAITSAPFTVCDDNSCYNMGCMVLYDSGDMVIGLYEGLDPSAVCSTNQWANSGFKGWYQNQHGAFTYSTAQ